MRPKDPKPDIHPEGMGVDSAIKMLQTRHKSLSIASRPSNHALATQQGSHPSKQIQSLTVLARGWNRQPRPSFRPVHPSRLQRRSFPSESTPGVFFRLGEIAWPLLPWLEDRCTRPLSAGTPIGASKTALGELSTLFSGTRLTLFFFLT